MFETLIRSGDELLQRLEEIKGKELYKVPREKWIRGGEVSGWYVGARKMIIRAFGEKSSELERWDTLKQRHREASFAEIADGAWDEVRSDVSQLHEALNLLAEYNAYVAHVSLPAELTRHPQPGASDTATRRVFIIHGHDETNTLRLKHLLWQRYGLEPVVLMDQPGQGRTIIEKFEHEAASCSFAFALLTPDDQVLTTSGEQTQARPNVVFELGWFYGRLGRGRVVILLKRGTQIHSDLSGIERYEFGVDVTEQVLKIEEELTRAGLMLRVERTS